MPRSSHWAVAGVVAVLMAAVVGTGCATAQKAASKPSLGTMPTTSADPARSATTAASSTTTVPQTTVPGAPPVKVRSPQLAPAPPAQLSLSTASASTGTTVSVAASGCPEPTGGYRGFFADSQALGDPQTPSYRHDFVMTASGGNAATGTYQVSAVDTVGFGLMEVPCGAATNAVAVLAVTG
jgi:hypothetical protein